MNVNLNETRKYYNAIAASSLCDCYYCKNYRLQIKAEYPEVAAYLESLGIDIEKPFETSPLEPDANGILEYCACQYIVFGTCEAAYQYRVNDVEFRKATSYPGTGIDKEHFVLEFYPVRLKFVDEVEM